MPGVGKVRDLVQLSRKVRYLAFLAEREAGTHGKVYLKIDRCDRLMVLTQLADLRPVECRFILKLITILCFLTVVGRSNEGHANECVHRILSTLLDTEFVWEYRNDSKLMVPKKKLEAMARSVKNLLGNLHAPKEVRFKIEDGATAIIGLDGTKTIPIPTRYRNDSGKLTHPERILNIVAHETAHPFFVENMDARFPGLRDELEHPKSVEQFNSLNTELRNITDRPKFQGTLKTILSLDSQIKIDLLKGEILRGYDEFFADLTAVIELNDPRGMSTLGAGSGAERLYEVAFKYRRFDLPMGPRSIQKWKNDLIFYNKRIGREGSPQAHPDRYLMLSPLRSWLWPHVKGLAATKNDSLPERMATVFNVLMIDLPRRLDEATKTGQVDLELMNRQLLDQILKSWR
jgi:hypothetical protein